MSHEDNDVDSSTAGGQKLFRNIGGVEVHVGQPGKEVGHQEKASSFFDRMWTKGQKKRRYTLHLQAASLDG